MLQSTWKTGLGVVSKWMSSPRGGMRTEESVALKEQARKFLLRRSN